MERAMVWFKCAAMNDPVRPVLKTPAVVGWEAKARRVDLVIERAFKGDELLRRMKGWVTADVERAIDIFRTYGKLRLLDERDLVVETRDRDTLDALSKKLAETFGEAAWVEPIEKTRLE